MLRKETKRGHQKSRIPKETARWKRRKLPVHRGIVELGALRIEPQQEKRILERGLDDYFGYVRHRAGVGGVFHHANDLEKRILQVYDECNRLSAPASRLSLVRDFATHFPDLVVKPDWIRLLLGGSADSQRLVLRALANGFRAAERRLSSKRHWSKTLLQAARHIHSELKEDFRTWNRTLDRSNAASEWLDRQATLKAEEVIKHYPKVRHLKRQITDLLRKKQLYQASVLIPAAACGVRESDLRRKVD